MVYFELGDLLVDPLWVNKVEDAVHQLVLVVFTNLILHVLQDVQDTFHVLLHQFRSKQSQDGDRSLVQNENAIEEIEIPDMRHYSQWQGSGEQRHDPLVNVLPWLDLLHLEVVAEVRQVDLEQLLEKLEDLCHKVFVECVERHDRVLEHQVGEVHEGLVLILDVE